MEMKKIMAEPSKIGYCERELNNMNSISNHVLCPMGFTSDIGFHIKVAFSVKEAGLYNFDLPVDFDWGGWSVLDGVEMKYNTTDLSFMHLVDRGPHLMEILGAEECCDKDKSWGFTRDF